MDPAIKEEEIKEEIQGIIKRMLETKDSKIGYQGCHLGREKTTYSIEIPKELLLQE